MKTNFQAWTTHYNKILLPYYHRFCYLFPEGEEPSFIDFLVYCFRNTKQAYDSENKKMLAPIY